MTTTETDNAITGSYATTATTTDHSFAGQTGGASGTTYSQTVVETLTLTVTDTGDAITGSDTQVTTESDTTWMQELGVYTPATETYLLTESDVASTTDSDQENALSGDYTISDTATDTSSLQEVGTISTTSFSLNKTVDDASSDATVGNNLNGSYTTTTAATESTATTETNRDSITSSFTEAILTVTNTNETGNDLSGDYTIGTTGTTTTSDTDAYNPTGGSTLTMGENSSQTCTEQETGNSISGDYTLSATAAGTYTMQEYTDYTGPGTGGSMGGMGGTSVTFTLTETGSLATTTNEPGNTVAGDYSQVETASDGYTLAETGTNGSGSFSVTVVDAETATLTATGNTANQTMNRTIVGVGSGYSYTVTETADARSGYRTQAESGTDRYSLVPYFVNVSDTDNADMPGNMDYSPFGQPFVDPSANAPEVPGGDSSIGASANVTDPGTSVSSAEVGLPVANPGNGGGGDPAGATLASQSYTINNYDRSLRATFTEELRGVIAGEAGDWRYHHSYEVGSHGNNQILATRLWNERQINVHEPGNVVLVPTHVHRDISNANATWWRQQMAANGWTTLREAYENVDLRSYVRHQNRLWNEYRQYAIGKNGTIPSLNGVRSALGLPAYIPNGRNLGIASSQSLRRWSRDRGGAMARWGQALGITLGALAILGTLAQGAATAAQIANPDLETQDALNFFLLRYQDVLNRRLAGAVVLATDRDYMDMVFALNNYLQRIQVDDQTRATIMRALLLTISNS